MTSRTPTFHRTLIAVLLGLILAGGVVRLILTSDWYHTRHDKRSGLARVDRALRVDVDGAVRQPGVYSLPAGAIRDDAVKKAGGRTKDADTSRINLAVEIKDREKIYIPFKGENNSRGNNDSEDSEVMDSGEPNSLYDGAHSTGDLRVSDRFRPDAEDSAGSPDSPSNGGSDKNPAHAPAKSNPARGVNINTADAATLMSLPGIGETYARRIIDMRRQRGPFKSIEEIMLVKGIGEKKFEKMKPYIRVN